MTFLLAALILAASLDEQQAPDAAALIAARCASCHSGIGESRAPSLAALKDRSPEAIVDSLTGGAMRYQGLSLSGAERRAIAEHITGKALGAAVRNPEAGRCGKPIPRTSRKTTPLTAAQLPTLTIKWAFGFPEATSAWSQPAVDGDRLFVGSQNGFVYALDAHRGCIHWSFEAKGGVRTSIAFDRRRAYFADQVGFAYAVDKTTGRLVWTRQIADHPLVRLTGSPLLFEGRLYVPTSSYEEAGKAPDYALIAGQKSGIGYALDPDNGGAVIWEYRAGRGGALGGIEWGIAVDREHAYFPVADVGAPQPGGLHAVKIASGERAWFAPPVTTLLCGRPARGCTAAQSAAITVIPGAVLSGAFDGGLRAYSTRDGSVLWEFDTNREFLTTNGVRARGGSLNGPAPVMAGGLLFVSSGDYRGRPGNVLLALGVD